MVQLATVTVVDSSSADPVAQSLALVPTPEEAAAAAAAAAALDFEVVSTRLCHMAFVIPPMQVRVERGQDW